MQQSQGVQQSNGNQRRNIYYLSKDVFCPEHQGQKIEWLNLSQNCEKRFYCEQCTMPENEQIFKYDDILKEIPEESRRDNSNYYATELEKAKKILFSQLQQIEYIRSCQFIPNVSAEHKTNKF